MCEHYQAHVSLWWVLLEKLKLYINQKKTVIQTIIQHIDCILTNTGHTW